MVVAPAKKSAADRLAAAKAGVKRTERKIDIANEHRREVLRQGDANGTAAIRADDEIAALRLLRLRYIDQVELLAPIVAHEQPREVWPSSLPDAQTALANLEPWLARLQSVPKLDRSAALDQQIDHLVQRQYALRKLIRSLQPEESAA